MKKQEFIEKVKKERGYDVPAYKEFPKRRAYTFSEKQLNDFIKGLIAKNDTI